MWQRKCAHLDCYTEATEVPEAWKTIKAVRKDSKFSSFLWPLNFAYTFSFQYSRSAFTLLCQHTSQIALLLCIFSFRRFYELIAFSFCQTVVFHRIFNLRLSLQLSSFVLNLLLPLQVLRLRSRPTQSIP